MSAAEMPARRERTWPWFVLGACGSVAALAVLIFVIARGVHWRSADEGAELLSLSNPEQILRDSRQMMTKKAQFKDPTCILYGQDPDWQLVPASIRALNCQLLIVGNDGVTIEKGGGLHHFGLKALPEGSLKRYESDNMENWKELMPGLWFYEEKDNVSVLK